MIIDSIGGLIKQTDGDERMTNFPIVKEGWPFIGIMAFATVLTADWADFRWALIPGTVTGFFFYFFGSSL